MQFSYYSLVIGVSSAPFYYISGFLGLSPGLPIVPPFPNTAIVVTPTNPIIEIAVTPNQPIITMSMQHHAPSSAQSARVVVAGLQPNFNTRRLKGPSYISIPRKFYRQYKETYSLSIMESRLITFESNGRIVAMAGGIRNTNIEVTNRYLQTIPEIGNLPVERKVKQFFDLLGSQSRLAPLNKTLNFEEWIDLDSQLPQLVFSADSTYGRYKHNSGIKKIINEVLVEFCKQNPDMGFLLEYRPSEAEHPNQRTQLESVLLTRKDAYTYQLNPEAHLEKTKKIDLIMPPDIKSIPDWFIYNGEQTIELLEQLYKEGKLTSSAETFQKHGPAIRECIQGDIDDFGKTGIPPAAIDFPGQVRAMSIGQHDCARLHEMMMTGDAANLNMENLKHGLRTLVKRAKIRAAYINSGVNLFPVGTPAHRTQTFQSKRFLGTFRDLMIDARETVPSLWQESEFRQDLYDFKQILNGEGIYQQMLAGEPYKQFKEELRNPKSHLSLLPRTTVITND